MTTEERARSRRVAPIVLASVMAVAGVVALIVAISAQRAAPQPPRTAAGKVSIPAPPASTQPGPAVTTTAPGLAASVPTTVSIPSIGVESHLITLGQNADGSVEVPKNFQTAGWYNGSVTPGQTGPSVIVGHVDSDSGPGVFFRLGALKPGDRVVVGRADGTTATFAITGVREYTKNQFPTVEVYGNTTVPALRLVTCGGAFDNTTKHYLSNVVAFGQLA